MFPGTGCIHGEIIRSTWWTSDVVHPSTKKLPPDENCYLEIFLKQKLITDSAILNKWKFFSGMVDK